MDLWDFSPRDTWPWQENQSIFIHYTQFVRDNHIYLRPKLGLGAVVWGIQMPRAVCDLFFLVNMVLHRTNWLEYQRSIYECTHWASHKISGDDQSSKEVLNFESAHQSFILFSHKAIFLHMKNHITSQRNLFRILWQPQWLFLVPLKGGRWHIIPQLAVYTTYILPSGGLYNPYHLLGKPETTIDNPRFLQSLFRTCSIGDVRGWGKDAGTNFHCSRDGHRCHTPIDVIGGFIYCNAWFNCVFIHIIYIYLKNNYIYMYIYISYIQLIIYIYSLFLEDFLHAEGGMTILKHDSFWPWQKWRFFGVRGGVKLIQNIWMVVSGSHQRWDR